MKILLIVALILLILAVAACFLMSSFALGIRAQSLEEARAWQEERYDLSWYDEGDVEDYTIRSFDDYELHVEHIANPEKTGKYVIISHGYSDNRYGALKYGKMYLDLGFDLIVYDLRGHGLNEPTICTYTIRESRDLLALTEDTRKRYDDIEMLGLHGESLGAATTLASLRYKPQVDFAVSDCAFSEIKAVLKDGLKSMKLPGSLVDLASFSAKLRYGYDMDEMSPLEGLKDNQIPVLFIHGDSDQLIGPYHMERLMEENGGYEESCLIQGADHAVSVFTDPDTYYSCVKNFIENL